MRQLDKRLIVVLALSMLLLAFWGGVRYEASQAREDEVQLIVDGSDGQAEAEPPEPEEAPVIYVHVAGAVERAGVYEMQQGDRVEDALQAAGVAPDAAIDELNRAALLSDGQKLVVPAQSEIAAGSAQPVVAAASTETGKISINQADKETLMRLPGIGEVKAQAIIDYRQANGGFQKLEELKNVKGIGDKTYQGLMDQITL